MKAVEDPRFSSTALAHPLYDNDSKQYLFQLTLTNSLPEELHFYIASTFGFCLAQTTKLRCVAPNSQLALQFKLKPTNLLGKIQEKVSIFGSKFKTGESVRLNGCYAAHTRLVFNEQNILDPAIEQILISETGSCLKEAQELKAKGDTAKVLSKCQEAYQIMRCSQTAITEMVACRSALKDFQGALRDIESALMWEMNLPGFLLSKVEVLMGWFGKSISQNQQIFATISQAFEYIKNNYPFYHISPADKQRHNKLFTQFKQYSKMSQGKTTGLLKRLVNSAAEKLTADSPAMKLFISKAQFESELRQILLQQSQEPTSTPEEVLDPIGYQIMSKPYILPCGSSCEEQTLRNYFATNGYKDPITRQFINYELVFRNLNLQNYIKEHPQLKKWQKYEFDYLHH